MRKKKVKELYKKIEELESQNNISYSMIMKLSYCLNQISKMEMKVSSPNPTTEYYREVLHWTDAILNEDIGLIKENIKERKLRLNRVYPEHWVHGERL